MGRQRQNYIQGTSAPKIHNPYDDYDGFKKRAQEVERERRRQLRRKLQQRENLMYMLFLFTMTSLIFGGTMLYLTQCSNVRVIRREIEQKKTDVVVAKEENDIYENTLKLSIDYNEIYDVATKKLHMAYPKNKQIVYYEMSNEDYVRQFKDVPKK